MTVFSDPDFDDHEQIVFASDAATGLKAIIAIHDTGNGPALGGCRMWDYADEREAARDALRLARGMTYKSALAGLPLGGGKSVIIGDSRKIKTPELMRAMGRAVDRLAGRYIVAEDVGTTVEDMTQIRKETEFVAGLPAALGGRGDPSWHTARGCFVGLRAAVEYSRRAGGLDGLRVAVQGLGNVGWHLCRMLHEAGALLWVSDVRAERTAEAVAEFGATAAPVEAIHAVEADVFAPCALGAGLNDRTIPALKARIVAGSANNQLAESRHGTALRQRGVIYAPDYVLNAGGVINVAAERTGYSEAEVTAKVDGIHDTILSILARADRLNVPTSEAADRIAEERFRPHGKRGALAA